jgi:hypothetical protein
MSGGFYEENLKNNQQPKTEKNTWLSHPNGYERRTCDSRQKAS